MNQRIEKAGALRSHRKNRELEAEIYERQAEICAALASPVRLMILDFLAEGEATATELQERLGLPKSNMAQHLMVLKRAGILTARSEGRFQILSLAIPEVKQACGLVRRVLAAQMSRQAAAAQALRGKLKETI